MPTERIKIIYDLDESLRDIQKTERAVSGLDSETDKLRKETEKYGREVKKSTNQAAGAFTNLGTVVAGLGLIEIFKKIVTGVIQVGKKVVDITAEFQKLAAVLVNTLGSRSKAQDALNDIKQFAAETPFSVQQLSQAFIKLANQGFVPTRKELRKLGDLASSTGKEFDQLAEAIIDAQVGEFERLKEFGIRASKEGDKVNFTFKGVQEQVDFTEDSIQKYILSLGDAAGVSGAMQSISNTLAGQISNLGDSFDSLLLAIGESNTVMGDAIYFLSDMIKSLTEYLNLPFSQKLQNEKAELNAMVQVLIDNNDNLEIRQQLVSDINQKYPEYLKNLNLETASTDDLKNALADLNKEFDNRIVKQSLVEANDQPIKNLVSLRKEEVKVLQDINRVEDKRREKIKQLQKEYKAGDQADEERNKLFQARLDLLNEASNKEAEFYQNNLKLVREQQDVQKSTIADNNANFGSLLKQTEEVKEETKEVSKETAVNKGYLEEINNLAERYKNTLADIKAENRDQFNLELSPIDFSNNDPYADIVNEAIAEGDRATEEIVRREQESADKTVEAWRKSYEERKELQNEFTSAAIDIAGQLVSNLIQVRQLDLTDFNERKQEELESAGTNADAREAIERKYRKEEEKLREEQARKEKKANIQRAIIETALGIMKAVAAAPPPINIPLIAIQAALGAAQVAAISSTPAFKDGVIDLKGPGTATSDSISARLSNGESVMTAKATQSSKQLLESIQKGELDDKTFRLMMNGNIFTPQSQRFDDSRIVAAINKNRPSDFVRQGSTLFEVKSRGERAKQKIRRRLL